MVMELNFRYYTQKGSVPTFWARLRRLKQILFVHAQLLLLPTSSQSRPFSISVLLVLLVYELYVWV